MEILSQRKGTGFVIRMKPQRIPTFTRQYGFFTHLSSASAPHQKLPKGFRMLQLGFGSIASCHCMRVSHQALLLSEKNSSPWRAVQSPERAAGSSGQVQLQHHANVPLACRQKCCLSQYAPSKQHSTSLCNLCISFLNGCVKAPLLHPKGWGKKASSKPFYETCANCEVCANHPSWWGWHQTVCLQPGGAGKGGWRSKGKVRAALMHHLRGSSASRRRCCLAQSCFPWPQGSCSSAVSKQSRRGVLAAVPLFVPAPLCSRSLGAGRVAYLHKAGCSTRLPLPTKTEGGRGKHIGNSLLPSPMHIHCWCREIYEPVLSVPHGPGFPRIGVQFTASESPRRCINLPPPLLMTHVNPLPPHQQQEGVFA